MATARRTFALGPVQYSVTVMPIWGTAELPEPRIVLFHLVVRGIGNEDAEQTARRAVLEHLTESGMLDGLKEITVAALIPGRHPNVTEGVHTIPGEDDGDDHDEECDEEG